MDGNKIRRGPGRRIAKERRKRGMEPEIMYKYLNLPPLLQQKINDSIEALFDLHFEGQEPGFRERESKKAQYQTHEEPEVEFFTDDRDDEAGWS
ncbi:MAG: hypothetical protein KDI30_01350 [Pseudomonadales bacterium]|nr:hypothetical protein [Pseudomonadales bacterium]